MSSLIKGPLVGAAAVRELTSPEGATVATTPGHVWRGGVLVPVADVEHDGDRGPRAFRDPLSVLDQAADAQRAAHIGALLSAVAGLHVDEVAALAWVARQLPGRKLRPEDGGTSPRLQGSRVPARFT